MGYSEERTVVIIKPDGVDTRRAFEMMSRFERAGLMLEQCYVTHADEETAREHYQDILATVDEKTGKNIVSYFCSGRIMPTLWKGRNVIRKAREIGGTKSDPIECAPGTIRFDYSSDSRDIANREGRCLENMVHTSDSPESAEREIKLWFEKYILNNWRSLLIDRG